MHANSNISLPNNHLILLQFQHQNLLIQFLSSTLRLCVLLELYLSRFIVLVNKALWSWKEKRKEPTKKIELKIPLENMTLCHGFEMIQWSLTLTFWYFLEEWYIILWKWLTIINATKSCGPICAIIALSPSLLINMVWG